MLNEEELHHLIHKNYLQFDEYREWHEIEPIYFKSFSITASSMIVSLFVYHAHRQNRAKSMLTLSIYTFNALMSERLFNPTFMPSTRIRTHTHVTT
jgi:hypothetical protein